jgi:hypothetical protein
VDSIQLPTPFIDVQTSSFSLIRGLSPTIVPYGKVYLPEHNAQMAVGLKLQHANFRCLAREFKLPDSPYVMDLLFQCANILYLVEAKAKNPKIATIQAVRNAQIVSDFLGVSITPVSYCYSTSQLEFHTPTITVKPFNLRYLITPLCDTNIKWKNEDEPTHPITISYGTKQPLYIYPELVSQQLAATLNQSHWLRLSRAKQIDVLLNAYQNIAFNYTISSNRRLFFDLTGDIIDKENPQNFTANPFDFGDFAIFSSKEHPYTGCETYYNLDLPTDFRRIVVIHAR